MATKVKAGAAAKGANKRSTKPAKSGSSSKLKKSSSPRSAAKPTQHKPSPRTATTLTQKRKPPHLRYTEKELGVTQLNGIRPIGVQKIPNRKKGKVFVDDGEGMRTILAMVMAEKEGNIESKMMRARQMEEVREAKREQAEKMKMKEKEGRRVGVEERMGELKRGGMGKKMKGVGTDELEGAEKIDKPGVLVKKARKKVSFG